MGLFSNEVKTYVSSYVYNLAGDTALRPNMLKSTVLGAVLKSSGDSIGKVITDTLLAGPGMDQRRFFNWAKNNYGLGMPDAYVDQAAEVNKAAAAAGLANFVTPGSDGSLRVIRAVIDTADIDYWAEDWVRQNYPTLEPEEWTAYLDAVTEEMVITLPESVEARVAAPADMLWGVYRPDNRRVLFISYSIVTVDPVSGASSQSPPTLFTYRMGSGNVAFDTLPSPQSNLTEFYPAIPLRLDNVSIKDLPDDAVYEAAKKAYRKLTRQDVDDLLEQIEDNENIDQIDYAFLVQGIPLNTIDNRCREYLYKFFQSLILYQVSSYADYITYLLGRLEQSAANLKWERWKNANIANNPYNPLYGLAPDDFLDTLTSSAALNELRVHADQLGSFDMRLRWSSIRESQHTGNAKTFDGDTSRGMAAVGDYWIHGQEEKTYLFYQAGIYSYTKLEVINLVHKNYVYGAHAVSISGSAALAEEDESGFLIPLHYPVLKSLGLSKGSQIATASSYLMFNAYQNVTIKWWQRGAFRKILMIVAVVSSIFLTPVAALGAKAGVLGTNAAVGAYVGVTNVAAAAMVGQVVNSIAAIVISQIINKASVELFGEKAGAIIGTIASFVALSTGTHYAATGNLNVDWEKVFSPENLSSLTNSVTDAYSKWVTADINEMQSEIERVESEYDQELDKIEAAAQAAGMGNTGSIDPSILVDATSPRIESSDMFLNRTLLTGTDIIELSFALVHNYSAITLELPTQIR